MQGGGILANKIAATASTFRRVDGEQLPFLTVFCRLIFVVQKGCGALCCLSCDKKDVTCCYAGGSILRIQQQQQQARLGVLIVSIWLFLEFFVA